MYSAWQKGFARLTLLQDTKMFSKLTRRDNSAEKQQEKISCYRERSTPPFHPQLPILTTNNCHRLNCLFESVDDIDEVVAMIS